MPICTQTSFKITGSLLLIQKAYKHFYHKFSRGGHRNGNIQQENYSKKITRLQLSHKLACFLWPLIAFIADYYLFAKIIPQLIPNQFTQQDSSFRISELFWKGSTQVDQVPKQNTQSSLERDEGKDKLLYSPAYSPVFCGHNIAQAQSHPEYTTLSRFL